VTPFSLAKGLPLTAFALCLTTAVNAQTPYGVGAFYLGDDIAAVKNVGSLRCAQSNYFANFRWCYRSERINGRMGRFTRGTSVMHGSSGRIVYTSRSVRPAYLLRNSVKSEIQRLSRLYGRPRIITAPRRLNPVKSVIAYWGSVTLAGLDANSRAMLARGQSPRKGLLIDFLGDFRKSVRLGLPVYAYRGGAGFVWRAMVDGYGAGRLRFAAVDASAFMQSAIGLEAARARRGGGFNRGPSPRSEFSIAPRGSEFSTRPRRSAPPNFARPRVQPPRIARATRPPARRKKGGSSGTGFFINTNGTLVTNAHVVKRCSTVTVTYRGGQPVPAQIVARDVRNDLAVLKTGIKPEDFAPMRLQVDLGEPVAAFGYPLAQILSKSGNFSLGNVTSLAGLSDDTRKYQISVPVQPGNSGGPLLDYKGNVVGVVTSKLNALKTAAITGDVPQNVNFAIKSTIVTNFLDSSGAQYSKTLLEKSLTTTELAKRAKRISVFISCRR